MMSSTTGLPLEMILDQLDKRDLVVDWIDFYEQGEKHRWVHKTIMNRIETSTGDFYGPRHRDEIVRRILFWLRHRPILR